VPNPLNDELMLVIITILSVVHHLTALSTAASISNFNYETSEAAGTKIVSRDLPSPVSTLALVSKAGTRYQWLPGLAEALEHYAFKVIFTFSSFSIAEYLLEIEHTKAFCCPYRSRE
jgi:hypothetical protein